METWPPPVQVLKIKKYFCSNWKSRRIEKATFMWWTGLKDRDDLGSTTGRADMSVYLAQNSEDVRKGEGRDGRDRRYSGHR